MRRRAATLLLTVLLVPASLRLAAASGDAGRTSCPLKCAHHAGAAGADCCPLDAPAPGGCALSKCSGDPIVAPPLPGQPLLLVSVLRVPIPGAARSLSPASPGPPRSVPLPLPDHVPLFSS